MCICSSRPVRPDEGRVPTLSVGTDARLSRRIGDADRSAWALDKTQGARVARAGAALRPGLRVNKQRPYQRRAKKMSGNFKNAKYWRLEMASGICFVRVNSVSNSGQWIRKRSEIWRILGQGVGKRLGAPLRQRVVVHVIVRIIARVIEFLLSTTLARCAAQG